MSLFNILKKMPFPWLMGAILAVPLAAILMLWMRASSLADAVSRAVQSGGGLSPELIGQFASYLTYSSIALLVIALALIASGILHFNREIKFARAAAIRRLSHDRYRFLADGPPTIGIVRIDLAAMKLKDINRAAVNLFGLPRAEIVGNTVDKLVLPSSRPVLERELAQLLAGKTSSEIVTEIEDPVRGSRSVAWHLSSIKLPGEEPEAVAVVIDVTERIKAEEERLEKERLAGVLEMAGGTAHELNQPLQVVSGLVWMMLQKTSRDDPNYKKLKIISQEVERLSRLGQKIASISSYEVKSYVGDTKIIDIDKAAKERRAAAAQRSSAAGSNPERPIRPAGSEGSG